MKKIVCIALILVISLVASLGVSADTGIDFNEEFGWTEYSTRTYICDSSDETALSISKNFVIKGVTFQISAQKSGDGSAVLWNTEYGDRNTPSIELQSGGNLEVNNLNTVEKFRISRVDGKAWVLKSIWADKGNSGGNSITFAGMLNGVIVSTKKCDGSGQTLKFGEAIIDELIISGNDFYEFGIDNLKGNTEGVLNKKPTASSFTASSIYQNTSYTFGASQFGYADEDSDTLDHLKITSVPSDGVLWIDDDNNNVVNGSETGLNNGDKVTKLLLDANKLKYINTNGSSSSFSFKVNDGKNDSEATYTSTLQVISQPTVTLGLEPNSTIDENGGTTNIKANLSEVYNKNVRVNLAFSGTASTSDYSVPASIEIEAGQTSGTVTITGMDDTIYEGQEEIIIDIDSVTNGKESGNQKVICTLKDDDPEPLVTLQVDKTELTESPENCIVTIIKQGNTAKDIIVNLSVSGTSVAEDYNLIDSQITIYANENQKITTLSSIQDMLDEDNETIILDIASVTNGKENGTQQQTIIIIDDDDEPTVSLTLDNSPLVESGGEAILKATLSKVSGKNITINLSYSGTALNDDYTADNKITIDAGSTESSLTITGINDDIDEDTETIHVEIASIINAIVNGEQVATIEITDDDTAALHISESDGSSSVNEAGSSDVLTIKLASKPINDVVLNVVSMNTDEVDVDKNTLTFTSDNWNVSQIITLTGKDDNLVDGNQNVKVNMTVVNDQSDDKYDGMSSSINTEIIDDDIAGFSIKETNGGTTVSENETSDSFTVKLNAQPESNVVVNINNSDTTEKSIDDDNLTFTKNDWDIEQTVTVKGVDDNAKDGDKLTNLTLSIDQENSDDKFDSVASQVIPVTTIDNDIPNIIIIESNGGTSVVEGSSAKDQIIFKLSTQPADGNDVDITLTPVDTGEVSLSETTFTILNAEWNKEHTVTITSVNDGELDGDVTSTINISTTSSDSEYQGLTKTVQVITIDDEQVSMSIIANNNPINNGSNVPTVENSTDFGSLDVNKQTVTKTYTVKNNGNYDLNFTNTPIITLTGDADFTVESQPETIVTSGASTTFTIKFDPSTTGEKTGSIAIANNDKDNDPYVFKIKGIGTKDVDEPVIEKLIPQNKETNVEITANLEITFNEKIKKGIGYVKVYKDSDNVLKESISVNDVLINEKVVAINPINDFEYGTKYYVQIDNDIFTDEVGNGFMGISDKTTWNFTTKKQENTSGGSSSGGSSSSNNFSEDRPSDSKKTFQVEVNGKKDNSLGKSETEYKDGEKIITVSIDENNLEAKLKKEALGSKITIPGNSLEGSLVGRLNGKMVKKMEEKEAVVEIRTPKASYTLPANQINIDKISDELGEDINLKDIDVAIRIRETSKDMVKVVEDTMKKDTLTLVIAPVDFEVTCSYKSKEIDVSKFTAYVERTIALSNTIDPNKVTTGIIVYPDGNTCHVPTQVVNIGGKYFAKINSLTNSTYSVVWNPKAYIDLENHWAKDICNEMGARMIVEGQSETTFNPNQKITRLFFTESIVKALGLGDKGSYSEFTDIANVDEGFGYVGIGVEYKLIKGYPDKTFRPNNSITKEEAAILIVRAMELTGMKVDYTDKEVQNELNQFVDKNNINEWAKKPIAICSKNGLIIGNNENQFLPKANITKAELAIIINKLLKKTNLI